ncbi:sugar-binding protein [Candidatus Latescibacterota bacterium]
MKNYIVRIVIITVLMGTSQLHANSLVDYKIQNLVIRKTDKPPIVDGKFNDECWLTSEKAEDFILTAGENGRLAGEKTECYITYDNYNLYIAFKCRMSDSSAIVSNTVNWDDPDIFYDDRVEVFIDLNHDHRKYIELAVNPKGVQFDQSCFLRYPKTRTSDFDPDWNCRWRAETSIEKDFWIAEIVININSLGVDNIQSGMTWGFNVARVHHPEVRKGDEINHRRPGEKSEYSSWVPVNDGLWETISNFHNPIEFGDLVFEDSGFKVEQISFRDATFHSGPVFFSSKFGLNPLQIEFDRQIQNVKINLSVESESGKSWKGSKLLNSRIIELDYFIPENKENKLEISLSDSKTEQQLYTSTYILTTPPFIEFDLESLYTRSPGKTRQIRYRLETDSVTLANSMLQLKIFAHNSEQIIAREDVSELKNAHIFSPIFDIHKLRALPGGDYYIDCQLFDKKTKNLVGHFKQNFTKFDLDLPEKFQVVSGAYSFGGISDDAVQIQYPSGAKFVFWKAASNVPWWDIDQAAITYEFVETWGKGTQGCCEPMQDRECRYSSVRILEDSPARKVVHWQYALADAHYNIHENEWVDEYYRFYPDGVGVREVNLWANSTKEHEFLDLIPVKPPCVQSVQQYEQDIATLKRLDGIGYSTSEFWAQDIDFYNKFLESSNDFVFEFNLKDRLHPFTVFSIRNDLFPNVAKHNISVCSPKNHIKLGDNRGHWPASRYPIDGYNAVGNDRPRHGNIGNIHMGVDGETDQPEKWVHLIGITQPNRNDKYMHGKSWLYPAKVEVKSNNLTFQGYDYYQRAYIFEVDENASECTFLMNSNQEILNPAFIFKTSKAVQEITLGENNLDFNKAKIGVTNEDNALIFMDTILKKNQLITIQFSN